MPQNNPANEAKRVGKFGLVGILNTLLDFLIYNLASSILGIGLIGSNIISTSVAMIFSFFANQRFVFNAEQRSVLKQALVFFPVTAFGLYVIQSGIIYFLTKTWTAPLDLGVTIADFIGLTKLLEPDFLVKNGAKAVATLASLTWNYIMYKKVVFKK